MIDVNNVIDKLKKFFNVKTDVELSRKLGFSDRVVTTWKQRNTLNFEKIIEVAIKENIDLNYLFKRDLKKQNEEIYDFNLFEDFIFYNLKRTIFKESFFNKFNANLQFLFKVVKESISYVNFTREDAKKVLIEIIKNYEINSILDSDVKKENVMKFIEENLSNIECYVFLSKFEKFANM